MKGGKARPEFILTLTIFTGNAGIHRSRFLRCHNIIVRHGGGPFWSDGSFAAEHAQSRSPHRLLRFRSPAALVTCRGLQRQRPRWLAAAIFVRGKTRSMPTVSPMIEGHCWIVLDRLVRYFSRREIIKKELITEHLEKNAGIERNQDGFMTGTI